MPQDTGPFLQVAVLCESVLREVDGRISLIRLVDQLNVAGAMKEMQPQPVSLHMVVGFKAGMAHGKYTVRIIGRLPQSGSELIAAEQGVYFEGQDRGVNAVFFLNMLMPEEGVFWFDVLLEGVPVTRVPLRIMYQQLVGPLGFPSANP